MVKKPSILIIEPHLDGHHGAWLQWLIPGLYDHGFEILLGTAGATLRHPMFLSLTRDYGSMFRAITVSHINEGAWRSVGSLVKRELVYRSLLKRIFDYASERYSINHVFIPYMDYCAYALALFGSPFGKTKWSAILMRPSFHYRNIGIDHKKDKLDGLKKQLFFRMLSVDKYLRALFTIDPTLLSFLNLKKPELAKKLHYLPDPYSLNGSISRKEAKKVFGIPNSATVVFVYGWLSRRKGIDFLLTAMQDISVPVRVHVLLVGKQDDDVRQIIESQFATALREQSRLHVVDRYVDKRDEYTAFRAADIVWMGYRDHYQMSGVLVQSGAAALPVIATREGLIGWLTAKYKSGEVVSVTDIQQVASAISRLSSSPKLAKGLGKNGHRAFCGHTVNRALGVIIKGIGG